MFYNVFNQMHIENLSSCGIHNAQLTVWFSQYMYLYIGSVDLGRSF